MRMRPALVFAGIVLSALCAVAWYLYNKPHTGIAGINADMQIKAASIYNDFQQNEALANKKYLNKVIEVTGSISEIEIVNDSKIIMLSSGNDMGGVSCKLSNEENKKSIPAKPATVTIKGKCSGYTMDVNLVDCILK